MKKIGVTSIGTVIVEMTTTAQFDALERLQAPSVAADSPTDRAALTGNQCVAYVRERIGKLRPKKRDAVVSSIRAMFQFNGGISDQRIDDVVAALQKESFLSVDADGRVSYKEA